jgi:divalent metal cation (Fe/Co/Zn/Cd) transporter
MNRETSAASSAPGKKAEQSQAVARPVYTRATDSDHDTEAQRSPSYTPENDPYHLAASLKTPEQITAIRSNSSRKRENNACAPLTQVTHARRLQHFYESQNENIERLLKPVDDHRREAKEEAGADAFQYKVAVYASFAANICLAVLQLYGAIASGSLSLFTTCADAVFDPLSNVTLILCNRAVNRVDGRKYPSGKARIETAGNICFCFLMCSVSFILIVLSARSIAVGSSEETTEFHLPSVIAVATAFCVKLSLFLYCFALRNKYSQIRILWEDHRNDLFINGFGVMTSILGSKLRWWIDPMGSILLSVLIAFLWLRTARSEFLLLIGVSADTETLQLITYICKLSIFLRRCGSQVAESVHR